MFEIFFKILHGDLATRNILLAEENIVKICDFGFAKTMYNSENYKKKSDKVPSMTYYTHFHKRKAAHVSP